MPQFDVAGLAIHLDCENKDFIDSFADYRTCAKGACDLRVDMVRRDYIGIPRGRRIMDERMIWLAKTGGESGYYIYNRKMNQDSAGVLLDIDPNWENGMLYYVNLVPVWQYVRNLLGIIFRYRLINHGGLVVHASAVRWRGKGLIFSAPSGTGKSTHVRLWQECFGPEVEIINDDTPALRCQDGRVLVYGTPWSGNGSNSNISAPLEAIVVLEQAEKNIVQKLSMQEALIYLLPRCFLPFFDAGFMGGAVENLERIIKSVPVYLLRCRPDREAVEAVQRRLETG